MRTKPKPSRGHSSALSHLAAQGRKFSDRLAQARRSITAHGAIIDANGKLSANPALRLEREAAETFLSTMRLLNLDSERRRPCSADETRPYEAIG